MIYTAELSERIARSTAWWADHGHAVRQESAERERTHYGRMLMDHDYRSREILGEQMNRAVVRRQGLNHPQPPSRHVEPSCPFGTMTDLGDRIGRTLDNDGLGFHDYQHSYETKKNEWRQRIAEQEFAEHCEAETGMELSKEEFRKLCKKSRATMRQSKAIVEKMKSAGAAQFAEIRNFVTAAVSNRTEQLAKLEAQITAEFDLYRHDEYNLFIYWLHSKTVEELPKYRRSCLIPYIAAMTRAPKLAALEYFIQEHPFCKFWTFTTGTRCSAKEIPARLDWMFNRLRALNKELNRRWGVQIVFRTTEFGTLEADENNKRILPLNTRTEQMDMLNEGPANSPGRIERDTDGSAVYHPHAHCVVWSSRGHIGEDWGKVINFVHHFWKRDRKPVRWLADGIIRDARECCKYVTKPGDIINLSDRDLAAFAAATQGRRMVSPLGILADQIRDRKENGRILRRKRVGSKTRWVVALNHNRLTSENDEEKAARENLEDAYAFTDECEMQAKAMPPSLPGELDGGYKAPHVRDTDVSRVMARIGPAAGPTPLKEPRVIVMTNRRTPDMASVNAHPLVQSLWANTVEQWEAGRALTVLYNVHTGTSTGEDFTPAFPEFEPDPDFETAQPLNQRELPAFFR